MDLEGVISKKLDAPYRAGRQASWVKSKCRGRDEVDHRRLVVGEGDAVPLAAGGGQGRAKGLRYLGRVGTGYSAALTQGAGPGAEGGGLGRQPLRRQGARRRAGGRFTGSSRCWWPRSSMAASPRAAPCATPPTRACARTRPPKDVTDAPAATPVARPSARRARWWWRASPSPTPTSPCGPPMTARRRSPRPIWRATWRWRPSASCPMWRTGPPRSSGRRTESRARPSSSATP